MKNLLSIYLLVIAAVAAQAQQPSPDPDTLKNPVKQIDPVVRQEPADIHYIEESKRIAAGELPQPVLDSLKALEPTTWEKSVVYRQEDGEMYIVEIREGGQQRTYRFNKEGIRTKTLDQDESEDPDNDNPR
ncbi:MAG TPA: hypothetical protein VD927_08745 [Chryseosolibacter sp.]|nr:hypothetical protein [Chryseosolibacter sp.]